MMAGDIFFFRKNIQDCLWYNSCLPVSILIILYYQLGLTDSKPLILCCCYPVRMRKGVK
jgi:hypothetical protein